MNKLEYMPAFQPATFIAPSSSIFELLCCNDLVEKQRA